MSRVTKRRPKLPSRRGYQYRQEVYKRRGNKKKQAYYSYKIYKCKWGEKREGS